jgi:hypothetical protein
VTPPGAGADVARGQDAAWIGVRTRLLSLGRSHLSARARAQAVVLANISSSGVIKIGGGRHQRRVSAEPPAACAAARAVVLAMSLLTPATARLHFRYRRAAQFGERWLRRDDRFLIRADPSATLTRCD